MNFIKDRKLIVLFIALALLFFNTTNPILSHFQTEVTTVDGTSMQPTLEDRQSITLNNNSYKLFDKIERGDIVVVQPKGHDQYVKRIVGLPGEKVTFKNKMIFIDGKAFTKFHSKEALSKMGVPEIEKGWDVELGKDEYYVLSDNLDGTADSRLFNSVDKEDILGEVTAY